MPKVRTTITISKDLLKLARENEINISSFVDIELRRYLAYINSSNTIKNKECGYRDLNPGEWLGKPLS